jgi:hypothetical protein
MGFGRAIPYPLTLCDPQEDGSSTMRNPPQIDHRKRSMPIGQNAACRSTKTLMPISKNALMPIRFGPAGVIGDRHGRFLVEVT